ncbi:hypothetical protein [Agaribacter marinus]|uniref:Uncharacterized protein n=1 Tax=Agaribacter marinus TaxID=1431249 RepID=A0AA37WJQ7_9ALTE|nr:hypothetical protein [Agaribacter marinus]GLR72498.1 hypothetical protein GCM10007852_34060 [Agaribacter marinus]
MKKIATILLALSSFSIIAAENTAPTKNSFSCMDKQTFEVDAKCISTKIETSDSFSKSQTSFWNDAVESNEYVMATMLMDPKTLNITVIAHRDTTAEKLAKLTKLTKIDD